MKNPIYRMLLPVCVLALIASVGVDAREVIVRRGESLSLISERELGSMDRWQEIASLNGIRDPRRLAEGQRLRLPEDGTSTVAEIVESPSASPHVAGRPSVRRTAGAVRARVGDGAWGDLNGAIALQPRTQLMTASNGRAEFVSDGLAGDLGPFSILQFDQIGQDAALKLSLGALTLRVPEELSAEVAAAGSTIKVRGAEVKAQVDEQGLLRLNVMAGKALLVSATGVQTSVEAGQQASLRRGAATPEIKDLVMPVRLIAPENRATVTEENVLFQWTPAQGATAYQFILTPDDDQRPQLVERVDNPKILVRAVPEGGYSWRVVPLGLAAAVPSLLHKFSIDRSQPELKLNPASQEGADWTISGRTTPGAFVAIGRDEIVADGSGDFAFTVSNVTGLAVVGVEARVRRNGPAARGAVAFAGRPERRTLPVLVAVPGGEVMLNGAPPPATLTLPDGSASIDWQWDLGGQKISSGRINVVIDMTPPEIRSVRTAPTRILPGDSVTIRVGARDLGVGLAGAATARLSVVGPANFTADLTAIELTPEGEYVFRCNMPKRLPNGMLRVTKLEVADADGNAIILSAEGMAAETVDPGARSHKFLSNVFLIGLGVLIGTL